MKGFLVPRHSFYVFLMNLYTNLVNLQPTQDYQWHTLPILLIIHAIGLLIFSCLKIFEGMKTFINCEQCHFLHLVLLCQILYRIPLLASLPAKSPLHYYSLCDILSKGKQFHSSIIPLTAQAVAVKLNGNNLITGRAEGKDQFVVCLSCQVRANYCQELLVIPVLSNSQFHLRLVMICHWQDMHHLPASYFPLLNTFKHDYCQPKLYNAPGMSKAKYWDCQTLEMWQDALSRHVIYLNIVHQHTGFLA